MNYLFVIAMENEAKPLLEKYNLEKIKKNFFKKDNLSLVITGVSRNAVVNSLLDLVLNNDIDFNNTNIINVGLVGSNKLSIGNVVMVKKSYGYHFDLTPFGDPLYHSFNSPYSLDTINNIDNIDCYTSDGFVLKTDIEEPVIFDMELNAIIPFSKNKLYSIKIVSDTLDASKYRNFCIEDAHDKLFNILDLIIK